jgi:hypothetical protein
MTKTMSSKKVLKIADESLAMLDKEIKRTGGESA